MTEREILENELTQVPWYSMESIIDFIIEDRKRICAPLVEWKKDLYIKSSDAIREALKLAGLEKEIK